jgi:aspartate aminotransferase
MAISRRVAGYLTRASWIRAMFERGRQMVSEFGAENVCDLSLGNPHLDPPEEFRRAIIEMMEHPEPRQHGYMPNAGFRHVREAVAENLSRETGLSFDRWKIVMSVGAGGGLNIFLKTITEAGSRVIILAPYFAEYDFYIEAHSGIVEVVQTDESFQIDVDAVERVMGPDVEAVIINSPNNPTGVVYPPEKLAELGRMLHIKEQKYGREIYLISDEPYRHIVYNGFEVPWIFHHYKNSVVVTSHSKDLNLAGERIGYVALGPEASPGNELFRGMVFTQRALGMVSAPALMQRAVAKLQGVTIDVNEYRRKRDLLYSELTRMGYEIIQPHGAFYLFPKAPGGDDVKFVDRLVAEKILVVPGVGFGRPGHFRISYAVNDEVVERALPGFERAIRDLE